jgi:hypothetical protein
MRKAKPSWFLRAVTLAAAAAFTAGMAARAQTPAPAAALVVKGVVKQELHLNLADLKALPRVKVSAKGHDGTAHEYEGVALESLYSLKQAYRKRATCAARAWRSA